MFKRITIELSGPICTCEEQELAWAVGRDGRGYSRLHLTCEKCKTELIVSNDKFRACFKLDTPYPKGRTEKKDAQILKLVPGEKKDDSVV